MSKEKDIVSDILGRAEAAVREFVSRPEFSQSLNEAMQGGGGLEQRLADQLADQIKRVDAPVRQHWARSDAYVPARSPAHEERKRKAIAEACRTGNVSDAASRHGVSRSTIYRLLKK